MAETAFGIRSYTCSDKTKRPQKGKVDIEKIEKRNSRQRRLYITLDNIDELFSNKYEDKWPVCYDMMFNLIQGKVTKYFSTRSYDRKKEVSYDCMNRLYSILKRKLIKQQEENKNPCLFFYLSQFFRYIDLLVFSTVFYDTQDYKYFIQEPEDFNNDDVLRDDNKESEVREEKQLEFNFDSYSTDEIIKVDNSAEIKLCIENNHKLEPKEKTLLLKLYKRSYLPISNFSLTKKEEELLNIIRHRLDYEPDLLNNLRSILDAEVISED